MMYFNGWSKNSRGNSNKNNTPSLLSYFNETNKDELVRLAGEISIDAKDFFEASVNGLLGYLPEEAVDTTITMSKGSLAQMLLSSMVTGYVTKSVENKISLEKLLNTDSSEKPILKDQFLNVPPKLLGD